MTGGVGGGRLGRTRTSNQRQCQCRSVGPSHGPMQVCQRQPFRHIFGVGQRWLFTGKGSTIVLSQPVWDIISSTYKTAKLLRLVTTGHISIIHNFTAYDLIVCKFAALYVTLDDGIYNRIIQVAQLWQRRYNVIRKIMHKLDYWATLLGHQKQYMRFMWNF